MVCEEWREKMDAYLDGELTPAEASALSVHTRSCAACASDALARVQLKRSVAVAGRRYEPSDQLRAGIAKSRVAKPRKTAWQWAVLAVPALSVLILSLFVNFHAGRDTARRQRVYSELADLHVAALASPNPVDVLSSDRHTVKPWFAGKLPFTFNLPELQGSEFTLLGGRVIYLAQTPGAHLIYQVRKHEISVFIFQDRGDETAGLPSGPMKDMSFNFQTWTQNGLRYFVVGDVGPEDIQALSKLLRDAL
jgi:anti-sigma factor RsiW